MSKTPSDVFKDHGFLFGPETSSSTSSGSSPPPSPPPCKKQKKRTKENVDGTCVSTRGIPNLGLESPVNTATSPFDFSDVNHLLPKKDFGLSRTPSVESYFNRRRESGDFHNTRVPHSSIYGTAPRTSVPTIKPVPRPVSVGPVPSLMNRDIGLYPCEPSAPLSPLSEVKNVAKRKLCDPRTPSSEKERYRSALLLAELTEKRRLLGKSPQPFSIGAAESTDELSQSSSVDRQQVQSSDSKYDECSLHSDSE